MTKRLWIWTMLGSSALGCLIAAPVPRAAAGGFCGGPVVSAPIVSSYSAPVVSSYNYTPQVVVEKVVEKEIAPVAVPVIVPAAVFQYLPALSAQPAAAAAPAPCAHTQAAATPCQQAAAAAQVQTGAQVQTANTAATTASTAVNTANIDQLIKSRLDVILKQYQYTAPTGEGGAPASDAPDGPPPLQVEDTRSTQSQTTAPAQTQTTTPNTQSSGDTVNNWVVALQNNCAECHTQGKKESGQVHLFAASGQYSPNVSATQILDAIRTGRMPRGHKLDDATRVALLSVQAQ